MTGRIAQVSGILAALCITGAIFQNLVLVKVGSVLPDYSPADIVHLTTGTSSSLFLDLDPGLKQAVIAQVTDSIRYVFAYVLAVASLGFVLSLFLNVSDMLAFKFHDESRANICISHRSARSCTSPLPGT